MRARPLVTAFALSLLIFGQQQVITAPAAAVEPTAAIPRAECGDGSSPETGVQGQVPKADRDSGRSQLGYSCNLSLVGQYQGEGASWVNPTYKHCAYLASSFPGTLGAKSSGVSVLDVSDPAHPVLTAVLSSPAMIGGTWESLKVNEARGLLGAVAGGIAVGVGSFDVYDIATDCAHPRLLNGVNGTNLTIPVNTLGHEGNWSPDGNTYWATGLTGGVITAIDVADPAHPRTLFVGSTGLFNHGLSVSEDGNRIYVSNALPAGLNTFDVSDIQSRRPFPQLRQVSSMSWSDGLISQASIPLTVNDRPYLVTWDEFSSGGIRILDISDETNPTVTSRIKLEINQPQNIDLRREDTAGNGMFGYDTHYCSVNRVVDPTALACGFFQSGVRVFDISDISKVKEIAYFNPPAQVGKRELLKNSEHANGLVAPYMPVVSDAENLNVGNPPLQFGPADLSADYCSSPPRFVGNQLWVTCQDNGFLALQFDNGAYHGG
ncbi:LVIVD repeat-containing protein [Nocardia jinanensis]|uniref:YncE family protein n=1 Tax=Nocardia jinanensis TaxID=382504 RepID=A0A917VZ32_9NOCA|nr:hypothetical protein [Nocardia jinanensis]GGL41977.1 hypothetical protein GCM10011588_65910 [Nocardia jinanensis]